LECFEENFVEGRTRDTGFSGVKRPAQSRMTIGQVDIDLDLVGKGGFNCFHAACASGNMGMADYLLN